MKMVLVWECMNKLWKIMDVDCVFRCEKLWGRYSISLVRTNLFSRSNQRVKTLDRREGKGIAEYSSVLWNELSWATRALTAVSNNDLFFLHITKYCVNPEMHRSNSWPTQTWESWFVKPTLPFPYPLNCSFSNAFFFRSPSHHGWVDRKCALLLEERWFRIFDIEISTYSKLKIGTWILHRFNLYSDFIPF